MRAVVASLLALVFFAQLSTVAFAATTGNLNGTVTDSESHSPVANVKVTASAPTGTYSATSDARGFFSIAGVYSDTYTVSFQVEGYEPLSVPGVTVFAGQVQTENVAMAKSLKTIAKVSARSAGGAFQPNQTANTYTVTSKQIQSIQGNALNLDEVNLITSLPGASQDSSGYPVIRGGRENEENFEFEGIPFTDAFTNQFTNTLAAPGLGLQSAQLTPGLGDASQDNYGTGTFNLVAKRGSYPGYATAQALVGGPAFRHALNLEYGFASPNGRFSNYAALTTNYQGRAYGGSVSNNDISTGTFYSRRYQTESEFLDNFIFKFGKNGNQNIQLFTDIAQHNIFGGHGGLDSLPFRTNDPLYLGFLSANTGIAIPDLQTLIQLSKDGQQSVKETLGQAVKAPYTYYQPNISYKLGYAWNINSSTFLQAMAYHTNSVTIFDFPLSGGPSATGTSHVDQQGGLSSGLKIDLTEQLSEKNLFKIGAAYRFLHPVFDQVSNNYGPFNLLFGPNGTSVSDFLSPAQCVSNGFTGANAGTCGYIYNNGTFAMPAGTQIPNGYQSTSTNRNDYAVYVNDTWSPNDKLKIDAGLRMDVANYQLPPARIDPFTCTSNYAPQYVFDSSGNLKYFPSTNPNAETFINGAAAIPVGNCPQATFPQYNQQTKTPHVLEPVLAVSYRLGANDNLRASYGRSVEFASLGTVDLSTQPGYFAGNYTKIPGYGNGCGPLQDQACANYATQLYWDNNNTWGFLNQIQPVKPTVFTNYDFSWGHQFTRGALNGVAFKVTPFYRKAQDEVAQTQSPKIVNGKVLTDPNTNAVIYGPSVASNQGRNEITGIEAQITRDVAFGLSGQVSMTYQNEFSSVIPLSGSEDFFPTIPPSSLNLGNAYRVGFLSPFVASVDLSYQTRSGWRIAPQFQYNIGYPLSPGLLASATINGKDVNVPNTNASLGLTGAPGGTDQYVDPMNPGSFFNPNVAATRGIPVTSSPGGKLSAPASLTNLTIEYNRNAKWTAGLQVFNVFNELHAGPTLNGRYQALATGLSGPLTGLSSTGFLYPQYGFTNYGTNRGGPNPYIDTPNGIREYYVYFTVKM
jgi:hypothetical protein